jgi:hypothetical protein
MSQTCRTCANATTKPGHTQHYKVGLRNCFHLPAFRFVSGHHTCNRWTAKAPEKETEHAEVI